MSRRAKRVTGSNNPTRWMAEIRYRGILQPFVVAFEEIEDLDEMIEQGPDWRELENIVITLNRTVLEPSRKEAA